MLNWALWKLLLPLFLEFLHQQIICLVDIPPLPLQLQSIDCQQWKKSNIYTCFKKSESMCLFVMCDGTFFMPGEFCYQLLYIDPLSFNTWSLSNALGISHSNICRIFELGFNTWVVVKAQMGREYSLVWLGQCDSAMPILECWLIFQVLWGQNSRHLHRRGFCIVSVKNLNNCRMNYKTQLAFL